VALRAGERVEPAETEQPLLSTVAGPVGIE
jgi:hypothetical protein